jgi:hypothetical protein
MIGCASGWWQISLYRCGTEACQRYCAYAADLTRIQLSFSEFPTLKDSVPKIVHKKIVYQRIPKDSDAPRKTFLSSIALLASRLPLIALLGPLHLPSPKFVYRKIVTR